MHGQHLRLPGRVSPLGSGTGCTCTAAPHMDRVVHADAGICELVRGLDIKQQGAAQHARQALGKSQAQDGLSTCSNFMMDMLSRTLA